MKRLCALALCFGTAAFGQLDHPAPGQPSLPPAKVIPPAKHPENQPGDIAPLKADKTALYDETADARKQIAAAMKAAGKENRRVLIQWGGNWCSWCHLLHAKFKSDPALKKELLYEYDLVLVDAGKDGKNLDVAAMYKADVVSGGYPYLTILDPAGNVIANQETGSFETKGGSEPGHDADKVLAFLKSHEAKPLAADAVLKSARDIAKSSGRKVFLHFGAPWCVYCKKLEAWMARPNVEKALEKDFVEVKVDQDRMKGAKEVFSMYKKEEAGIPWFVILDAATGEPLATSDGPKGNIGFPGNDEEIAHFMAMMKKTAKKMSETDLELLKRTLEEGRKK